MAVGRVNLLLAAGALTLTVGCVDRRFVVETNVPGAQIYVDGAPIGPSPTDGWWEYAGYREFTAVAPGYEPLYKKVRFRPKWYEVPPLDLVAEVLWPFRIEDVRRVRLELEPLRPVNQLELVSAADALRARGATLPPSSVPDQPRRQTTQPTGPPIGGGGPSYQQMPLPQTFVGPRPILVNPNSPTWNQVPAPATPPYRSLPSGEPIPVGPAAPADPGPGTAPGRGP